MPLSWTFEAEYDTPQAMAVPILNEVRMLLDKLYEKTGLKSFEVKRIGNESTHYTYEWTTADNRKWKQELRFDNGDDPLMDFDMHNEFFRLSEFEPHRALRITVMTLIRSYGLKRLKVTT